MLHYQGACDPKENAINKTGYQQECRVFKLCTVPEGDGLGLKQERFLGEENSSDDRRSQM